MEASLHPGIWAHDMYMGPQTIASNPGVLTGFQANMKNFGCQGSKILCGMYTKLLVGNIVSAHHVVLLGSIMMILVSLHTL